MKIAIVVPCYNEEQRLPVADLKHAISKKYCHWIFIDDGSKDDTHRVISLLAADYPDRVVALKQPTNQGKAEAVRTGLNWAIEKQYDVVGFADADLATPTSEIERLCQLFSLMNKHVGMGARVRLLGTEIERSFKRFVFGRIYATCASLLLNLPVYDTQCGFKLFRRHPALDAALEKRFTSRWSFDVELIGRLLQYGYRASDFIEMPLLIWRDVHGSKLGFLSMLKAGLDLIRIGVNYRLSKKVNLLSTQLERVQ